MVGSSLGVLPGVRDGALYLIMTTRATNWVLQWGTLEGGTARVFHLCSREEQKKWRLDFHFPPRPAGSQLLHLVKAEVWFLHWRGRQEKRVTTSRAKWITHGVEGFFTQRWATWGGLTPAGGWGLTRDPAGEVSRPQAEGLDYTRGGYPLRGSSAPTPGGWFPCGGEDFLLRPRYV